MEYPLALDESEEKNNQSVSLTLRLDTIDPFFLHSSSLYSFYHILHLFHDFIQAMESIRKGDLDMDNSNDISTFNPSNSPLSFHFHHKSLSPLSHNSNVFLPPFPYQMNRIHRNSFVVGSFLAERIMKIRGGKWVPWGNEWNSYESKMSWRGRNARGGAPNERYSQYNTAGNHSPIGIGIPASTCNHNHDSPDDPVTSFPSTSSPFVYIEELHHDLNHIVIQYYEDMMKYNSNERKSAVESQSSPSSPIQYVISGIVLPLIMEPYHFQNFLHPFLSIHSPHFSIKNVKFGFDSTMSFQNHRKVMETSKGDFFLSSSPSSSSLQSLNSLILHDPYSISAVLLASDESPFPFPSLRHFIYRQSSVRLYSRETKDVISVLSSSLLEMKKLESLYISILQKEPKKPKPTNTKLIMNTEKGPSPFPSTLPTPSSPPTPSPSEVPSLIHSLSLHHALHSNLKRLHLSLTFTGDDLVSFPTLLTQSTWMVLESVHFDFHEIHFGYHLKDQEGRISAIASAMGMLISHSPRLSHLSIFRFHFTSKERLKAFVLGISSNATLLSIKMRKCTFHGDTFPSLWHSLMNHKSLEVLELVSCGINKKMMQKAVEMMVVSRENPRHDDHLLSSSFPLTPTSSYLMNKSEPFRVLNLRSLSLRDNPCFNSSSFHSFFLSSVILPLLSRCPTLKQYDISTVSRDYEDTEYITSSVRKLLRNFLSRNTQIRTLNLNYGNGEDELQYNVNSRVRRNNLLSYLPMENTNHNSSSDQLFGNIYLVQIISEYFFTLSASESRILERKQLEKAAMRALANINGEDIDDDDELERRWRYGIMGEGERVDEAKEMVEIDDDDPERKEGGKRHVSRFKMNKTDGDIEQKVKDEWIQKEKNKNSHREEQGKEKEKNKGFMKFRSTTKKTHSDDDERDPKERNRDGSGESEWDGSGSRGSGSGSEDGDDEDSDNGDKSNNVGWKGKGKGKGKGMPLAPKISSHPLLSLSNPFPILSSSSSSSSLSSSSFPSPAPAPSLDSFPFASASSASMKKASLASLFTDSASTFNPSASFANMSVTMSMNAQYHINKETVNKKNHNEFAMPIRNEDETPKIQTYGFTSFPAAAPSSSSVPLSSESTSTSMASMASSSPSPSPFLFPAFSSDKRPQAVSTPPVVDHMALKPVTGGGSASPFSMTSAYNPSVNPSSSSPFSIPSDNRNPSSSSSTISTKDMDFPNYSFCFNSPTSFISPFPSVTNASASSSSSQLSGSAYASAYGSSISSSSPSPSPSPFSFSSFHSSSSPSPFAFSSSASSSTSSLSPNPFSFSNSGNPSSSSSFSPSPSHPISTSPFSSSFPNVFPSASSSTALPPQKKKSEMFPVRKEDVDCKVPEKEKATVEKKKTMEGESVPVAEEDQDPCTLPSPPISSVSVSSDENLSSVVVSMSK